MHGPPAGARRLTPDDVARESGADPAYVDRLVTWGVLQPGPDGRHEEADVPRVRTIRALDDAGFGTDAVRWTVASGLVPVREMAGMWAPAEPSGRTFASFRASLGERGAHLPAIYAAFGLPEPPDDARTTRDEEEVVADFLATWALVADGRDAYVRAARIAGEGTRRLQAATMDLFDELGGPPPSRLRRGESPDAAIEPSIRLASLLPRLLVWLQGRHAEHELFSRIVAFVEHSLARSGRIERRRQEPAVAFVDLAGYTELTEREGDRQAAVYAAELHALAEEAARGQAGRVVKLLGDGVMLRFPSATDAVRSAQSLLRAIAAAGLPAAHAGVASGPLVVRDGDVFGRTVNLAARIAARAVGGELLVADGAATSLRDPRLALEDAGEVALKGFAEPVRLWRVTSPGE